jgi:single-strand DNA-binding protein
MEDDETQSLNVAVLRGTCSSPADLRRLPSGDTLAQLQVTTRVRGTALSVPVSIRDPKQWIGDLDAGDDVMVVGHVRRRFFRAGDATASRVEVEADAIAPTTDRRRTHAIRRRVDELLADLET